MTQLDLIKRVVNVIVGLGTAKVVNDVIENNVKPTKPHHEVTVGASSLVLGSMAADATRSYTDAKIDQAAAWWKNNVKG